MEDTLAGAQRLVLGKPGCRGCAGSNYLDLTAMKDLLTSLDGRLTEPMGGILFWDLSGIFSQGGHSACPERASRVWEAPIPCKI